MGPLDSKEQPVDEKQQETVTLIHGVADRRRARVHWINQLQQARRNIVCQYSKTTFFYLVLAISGGVGTVVGAVLLRPLLEDLIEYGRQGVRVNACDDWFDSSVDSLSQTCNETYVNTVGCTLEQPRQVAGTQINITVCSDLLEHICDAAYFNTANVTAEFLQVPDECLYFPAVNSAGELVLMIIFMGLFMVLGAVSYCAFKFYDSLAGDAGRALAGSPAVNGYFSRLAQYDDQQPGGGDLELGLFAVDAELAKIKELTAREKCIFDVARGYVPNELAALIVDYADEHEDVSAALSAGVGRI